MRIFSCLCLLSITTSLTAPVFAQVSRPDSNGGGPATSDEETEIVVLGTRPRGSVNTDVPPQVTLSGGDVRALGVSSVAELLTELAPQISSGGGRGGNPVVLINGQRTTGYSEVRDLPSEAIGRIEIFPEEVALRYGYRADQRVVNIVLRPRFRAVTTEIVPGLATAGGRASGKAELSVLRIDKTGRLTLNGQYQHDDALYQNERTIALASGATIDDRPYRTLLAASDTASLNGTINRPLSEKIGATVNMRGTLTESRAGVGGDFAAAGGPVALLRDTSERTGHVGLLLNGAAAPWTWSLTGNYDITGTHSTTERSATVRDRGKSTAQIAHLEAVGSGPLVSLPAGNAMMTGTLSGELQGFDSASQRLGLSTIGSLSRQSAGAQLSVDLPIASRRRDILQPLGDLSINFHGAVDRLSDFGSLTTLGSSLSWEPIKQLNLIVSFSREEGAPTMQQLGNPVLITPNVPVFDYIQRTSVDISRTDGGNPALLADSRRLFKIGMVATPLGAAGPSLAVDYTDARTRNVIASFPTATPEIEAAFPGRFVRDATGRLLSIDARPLNFARARDRQLRWTLNFSKRLGSAPQPQTVPTMAAMPGGRETPPAARRPENGEGGRGSPGGFRGGGGPARSRMTLTLTHIWHLRDDILIRPGVPALDLLNGSAADSAGGQPRHEIEGRAAFTKNGYGARVSGHWQGPTRVAGLGNGGDLHFSDVATIDMRFFVQLGAQRDLVRRYPWLRGVRINLAIDNLFDTRQKVRDAGGLMPLRYQGDFLDPLGRTIRIGIKKIFF